MLPKVRRLNNNVDNSCLTREYMHRSIPAGHHGICKICKKQTINKCNVCISKNNKCFFLCNDIECLIKHHNEHSNIKLK